MHIVAAGLREEPTMYTTLLKSIRFIYIFTALSLPTLCSASSFLPTSGEYQTFSPAGKRAINTKIASILASIPPGQEEILIDDMVFRTADLRSRSAFLGTRWSGGRVYYKFDSDVTMTNRQNFLNAAAEWTAISSLQFIQRTTQPNYIQVVNANVNSSYVGMIGGAQKLKMYNWTYKYVIAHEIGHALGLFHEHQRSDRANYVNILFANITNGAENNFKKKSTTNYGPYDFDSVMHYGKSFFSKNNLNTIEPLPAYWEYLNIMGNQSHLTQLDKDGMAARYGAPLQGEGTPVKITTSNCQVELIDPTGTGIVTLLVSNSSGKASIKIKRLSKTPSNPKNIPGKVIYHKITTVEWINIETPLAKFFSNIDITTLESQDSLQSITSKNATIEQIISSASIKKVKMTGQADASGASPTFLSTRIQSQGNADTPMKITLSGVILTNLNTLQAIASITATTKKYKLKNPTRTGVSLSGLGRVTPASLNDFTTSYTLLAASFGRIQTKGASVLPDKIQSIPHGNTTLKITAKSSIINGTICTGTIGSPGAPEHLTVYLPGIKSLSGDAGVSGTFIMGFDSDLTPTLDGFIKKITSKNGQIQGSAYISPNLPEPKITPDEELLHLIFSIQP